ncbi:hypothetical protein CGRA01v4_07500 [Colletotrichum graminicola]|nr:hypothetical protein CGRA01v4_07500 [Colletotrichum graminicola]
MKEGRRSWGGRARGGSLLVNDKSPPLAEPQGTHPIPINPLDLAGVLELHLPWGLFDVLLRAEVSDTVRAVAAESFLSLPLSLPLCIRGCGGGGKGLSSAAFLAILSLPCDVFKLARRWPYPAT